MGSYNGGLVGCPPLRLRAAGPGAKKSIFTSDHTQKLCMWGASELHRMHVLRYIMRAPISLPLAGYHCPLEEISWQIFFRARGTPPHPMPAHTTKTVGLERPVNNPHILVDASMAWMALLVCFLLPVLSIKNHLQKLSRGPHVLCVLLRVIRRCHVFRDQKEGQIVRRMHYYFISIFV